jgi:phage tail-like protein
MIFNSKKETILYINKLLVQSIEVSFHKLKFILDSNDIKIESVLFVSEKDVPDLSLKSIKFNDDESVILTINAYSWNMHLPEIYQDNELLKNFLFGIQTTALKQEDIIDNISELFRPETTQFIDWLSSWFGIKYHSIVNEEAKRLMLYNIIELYKCRGTKKYFIKLIKILTGVDIKIVEFDKYSNHHDKKNQKDINSFKVLISDKISEDVEVEKKKLKIITNIIDKEKPINTEAIIEYSFLDNIPNDIENENIVNYHDDYDYEELNN